jgi:uncharacterized membrane protein YphA (DoxX/SURF4 family)
VASWLLRLILVLIFVPHGVGKIVAVDAFVTKFRVPDWQSITLGAIEIAAALGMIAGAALADRWGAWLTRAAAVGIVLSQCLAIAYAKFPYWLEYHHGAEENAALIVIAVVLFLVPHGIDWRARRRGGDTP